MKKLTLSADEELIEQARKLAVENRTSISAMFHRFIRFMIQQRTSARSIGPLARKATGIISLPKDESEREVLTEALMDKHGLTR